MILLNDPFDYRARSAPITLRSLQPVEDDVRDHSEWHFDRFGDHSEHRNIFGLPGV
jgi:hypothetical protein